MEDSIKRKRYARHISRVGRYRRPQTTEKKTIGQLILRQTAICVVLLLIALLVKNINIPLASVLNSKIRYVLSENTEVKNILLSAEQSIADVRNNLSADSDKNLPIASDNSNEALVSEADAASSKTLSSSKDTMSTDDSSEEQFKDMFAENETSVLAASTDESIRAVTGMALPVNGVCSVLHGEKLNDITGVSKFHNGIDISIEGMSTVKSALDGKVIETGMAPAYGEYTRILHSDNIQTVYASCSELNVKKGDIVKKGDVIAQIGDEGLPIGAHLHFEVWKSGEPVDPLDFINVPIE